jgi:single-strand DNA-binding protein
MAFTYNHTTLVGRLVRDPEIKKLSENTTKLDFVLAISRGYKKEDGASGADFIPICIWGKTAELGMQFLKKGSPILVSGRIQTRHYEKDHTKHYITEVVADTFQLLEKKSPNDSDDDLDTPYQAAL